MQLLLILTFLSTVLSVHTGLNRLDVINGVVKITSGSGASLIKTVSTGGINPIGSNSKVKLVSIGRKPKIKDVIDPNSLPYIGILPNGGFISALLPDNTIAYIGYSGDGTFGLKPAAFAIPFTLNSECSTSSGSSPATFIDQSNEALGSTTGSIGTAPLNAPTSILPPNSNPATANLTPAQSIDYAIHIQSLATQKLVVDTIASTQYGVVVAISQAAQATFDTIAAARDLGVDPTLRSDPVKAADLTAINAYNAAATTAANAAYAQAYTACVAAGAQKATAITAYGATLTNPLDASSIKTAADAAALAISTAASAAAGNDSPGSTCAADSEKFRTSLSGSATLALGNKLIAKLARSQAALDAANIALANAQAGTSSIPITLSTPPLTSSNSISSVSFLNPQDPMTIPSPLWNIDCSTSIITSSTGAFYQVANNAIAVSASVSDLLINSSVANPLTLTFTLAPASSLN